MIPRTLARVAFCLALGLTSVAYANPASAEAHSTLQKPMRVVPAAPEFSDYNTCTSDPTVECCINDSGNYVPCSTLGQVEYYGHRVVSNPTVWVVFWTDKVDATTQQRIGGFYSAVTNSELFDWMIEYNTEFAGSDGSNQRIGRGLYGGAYTITPTTTSSYTVSDSDIQTELAAQMNNGQLPQPDYNTIFMVYFPSDYVITQTGGSASCSAFCAYHSSFPYNGKEAFYGVYPDLATGGCQNGCGGGNTFENLCSASTHELIETVTDGEISKPDYIGIFTGNISSFAWNAKGNGNEVGDMCNQFTDTITSLADGTDYRVQQIFSQNRRECDTEYYFLGGDYQFYANPTLLILSPGTTGAVEVSSVETITGAGTHLIGLSGSLNGVTAALDETTLGPTENTYLRFNVAANAVLNTQAVYTLTATPGPAIYSARTATLMVRIEPAPTALTLTGVTDGGNVTGTASLRGTATAAASRSLYQVWLYIDGNLVAQGSSLATFGWNTSGLTPGSQHTVTLIAEDYDGGNAQISDTVTVLGPPTVQITSPGAGNVTGMVSISAIGTAGTGSSISHLNLAIDGTQVGTSSTQAVAYTWDTSAAANGTHVISASIVDADGTTATATPVSVTVHNLPGITIAPASLSVSGVVPLVITGTPVSGATVAGLSLLIDMQSVAGGLTSPLTYSWDTTGYALGSQHIVTAAVTDNDTLSNSITETFTIVLGPAVSISAPSNGDTVSGSVSIHAQATAAASTSLSSLAVLVDGMPLHSGASGALIASWDTTPLANGSHVVTAVATDADTGSTSSSITVTVDNAPVSASDFTLAVDPSTATLQAGGAAIAIEVTTSAIGSAQPITLSVAGLPTGVSASLSSTSIMAGQGATLTLTALAGTSPLSGAIVSIGGTSGGHHHSATTSLSVTAGASSGCSSFPGWEMFALLGLVPLLREKRRSSSYSQDRLSLSFKAATWRPGRESGRSRKEAQFSFAELREPAWFLQIELKRSGRSVQPNCALVPRDPSKAARYTRCRPGPRR